MSILDRQVLARQMQQFGRQSSEMRTLQRAMDLLHPAGPRLGLGELVTIVLWAALQSHEQHTRATLHRLNEALARTLDDLEALRRGEPISGRTAGLRAADLTTIAQAINDLGRFEDRVRDLLATDPDGIWARALRAELGTALTPAPGATPATAARAAGAATATAPRTAAEATTALRDALHAAGPDPKAIWNGRELPAAVGEAAHALVVAAGGDVGAAVGRLLRAGGPDADGLVIAVLWREGRIAPAARDLGGRVFDIHQVLVTGLDFEWVGALPPGLFGRSIGIDGIAGGFVVDAKHLGGPLETSPHLLGEAAPKPTPSWRDETQIDVVTEMGDLARAQERLTPESRSTAERLVLEHKRDVLEQMERQLEFARHNGLRGIRWVCNDEALADAFRKVAQDLPTTYRDMQKDFTVGGLVGHGE